MDKTKKAAEAAKTEPRCKDMIFSDIGGIKPMENSFQITEKVIITDPEPPKERKSLHEEFQLPIWGFPQRIQEFIEAVVDAYQCKRDYVVAAVLSTIGAAIGEKAHCRDGEFINYANSLWIMIVGRSGTGKSEPLAKVLKPLFDYQRKLRDVFKDRKKEFQAAIKNGENADEPIEQRILVNQCTYEKLVEFFENNPSLLLYYDDSSRFCKSLNAKNTDRSADLNNIYSNKWIDKTTKTNGSSCVPEPKLGIIATIQPGKVLKESIGHPDFLINGFFARFCFILNEDTVVKLPSGKEIPEHLFRWWNNYIIGLCENRRYNPISNSEFPYIENYYGDGKELSFSMGAKKLLNEYNIDSAERETNEEDDVRRAIIAKDRTNVQRMALIVALIDDERCGLDAIQMEHMKFAIELMSTVEQWNMEVYEQILQPERPPTTADCIRGLKDKIKNQSQFAESIGVSQPYINKLINEKH